MKLLNMLTYYLRESLITGICNIRDGILIHNVSDLEYKHMGSLGFSVSPILRRSRGPVPPILLELRILPLQPDAPIYLPREADRTAGEAITKIEIINRN